jgi:hypothetical protein
LIDRCEPSFLPPLTMSTSFFTSTMDKYSTSTMDKYKIRLVIFYSHVVISMYRYETAFTISTFFIDFAPPSPLCTSSRSFYACFFI